MAPEHVHDARSAVRGTCNTRRRYLAVRLALAPPFPSPNRTEDRRRDYPRTAAWGDRAALQVRPLKGTPVRWPRSSVSGRSLATLLGDEGGEGGQEGVDIRGVGALV